jgi:NTE family protein
VNPKLEYFDAGIHGKPQSIVSPERSDELHLALAFSGGGTRAAALAYGVLEALARVEIPGPANPLHGPPSAQHTLLDQVDEISSVSGGSFTAAYYGLYGERIFEDFREHCLTRNINRGLLVRHLSPINWFRLASAHFGRSDLAAEYYDDILFDEATYGDLLTGKGPAIYIQATDIVEGIPFGFVPYSFALICSDLQAFPVSRAVAASAAFPGAFTTIVLRNYAGQCGVRGEPWITQALEGRDTNSRTYHRAKQVSTYLDPETKPYIHLSDGGIADNLGIRGPMELVAARGGARKTLEDLGLERMRRMAIVIVNAEAKKTREWSYRGKIPGIGDVIGASSSMQISGYNFETIELLHRYAEEWSQDLRKRGSPVDFSIIQVGFDALFDKEERRYFQNIPTTLSLPDETVDRLREVAGRILYASKPFRKLVHDLGGRIPAIDSKPIVGAEGRVSNPQSAELESIEQTCKKVLTGNKSAERSLKMGLYQR